MQPACLGKQTEGNAARQTNEQELNKKAIDGEEKEICQTYQRTDQQMSADHRDLALRNEARLKTPSALFLKGNCSPSATTWGHIHG